MKNILIPLILIVILTILSCLIGNVIINLSMLYILLGVIGYFVYVNILEIEILIHYKFLVILPSININISSKEFEVEWLFYVMYIKILTPKDFYMRKYNSHNGTNQCYLNGQWYKFDATDTQKDAYDPNVFRLIGSGRIVCNRGHFYENDERYYFYVYN